MGFLKAPKPPDPSKTAATQARLNTETAQTQARLAMTGQTTPTGNLSYVADPSSPSGYRAVSTDSADVAAARGRVTSALAQPIGTDIDARLMELGRARLDPMFDERSAALETDLINRGIRPGSDAYAAARGVLGRERTDAYNQLLLTGRGQALAERQAPLQELTMLLGGGNPQFGSTPAPGVAPVDYTGSVDRNFQAQTQAHGAMIGGLAGAAGSALGGWAFGGFPGARTIASGARRLVMGA